MKRCVALLVLFATLPVYADSEVCDALLTRVLHKALRIYVSRALHPFEKNDFETALIKYLEEGTVPRERVQRLAGNRLKNAGVAVDVILSKEYKGEKNPPPIEGQAFVFRPDSSEGAHPLNQLAALIDNELRVSLVYDFRHLENKGNLGSFDSVKKRIYVSHEFISRLAADEVFLHELQHAYFHVREQRAKRDSVFSVEFTDPLRKKNKVQGYRGYISLEELITHPISVRVTVWEWTKGIEDLAEVRSRVSSALNVAQISSENIAASLAFLGQRHEGNPRDLILMDDNLQLLLRPATGSYGKFLFADPKLIELYDYDFRLAYESAVLRALARLKKMQALAKQEERAYRNMLNRIDAFASNNSNEEALMKSLKDDAMQTLTGAVALLQ